MDRRGSNRKTNTGVYGGSYSEDVSLHCTVYAKDVPPAQFLALLGEVRGERQQPAVAILHHKPTRVPWRVGEFSREFHAPSDILDEADTSETVDIRVRATRLEEIDHDAQTCATSLRERVDLEIRGVRFAHERYADLGSRPYGDCLSSVSDDDDAAPSSDGDGKADELGAADEAPDAGGCAAAGSGGSSGLALVIFGMAFAAFRRRRR